MRPGFLPAGRLSCRRPAALTLSAEAHTNEANGPCLHFQSEEERVSRIRAQVTRRIKTLGEQGAAKEAIKELTSLNALGIAPDTQAATALLSACLRDMELAQSVFDELFVHHALQLTSSSLMRSPLRCCCEAMAFANQLTGSRWTAC
ncbi:predicted protein [Haematococcus lacustris]|uniref:Uncharacterized protein n=1 Tax=Haematococcus lacustris TaxID=44745 RepID=A0A699ZNY6_HAELA|nr:predicted protein [Haematococcus lacustris]